MDSKITSIVNAVVVIVVWLLQAFGVLRLIAEHSNQIVVPLRSEGGGELVMGTWVAW